MPISHLQEMAKELEITDLGRADRPSMIYDILRALAASGKKFVAKGF